MLYKELQTASAIAHFDLDSFFVAVERIKNPALIGKPVIVGGEPGSRAVVASASYEARHYGIHSAMPVGQALRLCPEAVIVRGSFQDYDDFHIRVREIVKNFSPLVEMTSIDEGYLDLTGTGRLWGSPVDTAEKIRWRIKVETGLDCSLGVARNKLVAKVAANFAKPQGLLWIKPGGERDFLFPLPIEWLPGVGPKTKERLQALGIHAVAELARLEPDLLERTFGVAGQYLHQAANGIYQQELVLNHARKSIGKEVTFRKDSTDPGFLSAMLYHLVEKVCYRLRQQQKRAQTVTVKYRYEDFQTHTTSRSLPYPVGYEQMIYEIGWGLLKQALTRRVGIRLIGVSVSGFVPDMEQLDLFVQTDNLRLWRRSRAIDQLRGRFGFHSVLTGEGIRLLNYVC
jgi:DNA polymerase-4